MAAVPRTLATEAGPLELVPAAIDDLRAAGHFWPMEILRGPEGTFALVFQHGEDEVQGLKLQPVDIPARDARILHQFDRMAIAAALPAYLEGGHRGVLLPVAYYREKDRGLSESGIAFFVGPHPDAAPAQKDDLSMDRQIGRGGSHMTMDMSTAIAAARRRRGFPSQPLIDIDVRPRSALGGISMDFLVEGPNLFVVTKDVVEEDLVWAEVVRSGFTRLRYASMAPAAFEGQPPTDMPRA